MVIGSNLDISKLSFLFAKISFGMNVKGRRNPSWQWAAKGCWKNNH